MKVKDIPTEPILQLMRNNPDKWLSYQSYQDCPGVAEAMPPGTHRNLVRAKMASLVRKGLCEGCTCGCRGDFYIK